MPRSIRTAVIALSLANLCFLASWLILLNPLHYGYYNWPSDPGFVEVQAVIICVLLLALIFWLAATIASRSRTGTRIAGWALLVVLILPLNSFISDYLRISLFQLIVARRIFLIVALVFAVAGLVILYRYNRQVTRLAITLLIVLSPLVLVNTVSAIWLRQKYSPPSHAFLPARPATQVAARADAPRVVWIIFDELDHHIAFPNRPEGIKLLEFDRFRDQSLSSANAYPPTQYTLSSMPSLTTGKLVAAVTPVAANDCELTLETGENVNWSTEPNIFSQARAEGFSTGLIGWYHAYCRVLGSSLDWCSWVPVVDHVNPALDHLSLSHAIWIAIRTAAFRIPLAFRLVEPHYEQQRVLNHQEEFERVSRAATTLLQQDLNLKLLHFPIPHHPWIYEGKGYVDNLVLADRTLGEVRAALESAAQWDSSIILVTSDHWWRDSKKVNGRRDHRVPFMLKLANQKTGMEYQQPFNTILTRELLTQLLRGKLTTPAEVAEWIEANAKMGESSITLKEP